MAAVAIKHALLGILLRPAIKYTKWSPVIYITYLTVTDEKYAVILKMYNSNIGEYK
jgi:predicted branched-subunit amino acid permease